MSKLSEAMGVKFFKNQRCWTWFDERNKPVDRPHQVDVSDGYTCHGGTIWEVAQGPDGLWPEEAFTGTGFPNSFYLRYHMYPAYFPLLALGSYRWRVQALDGADPDVLRATGFLARNYHNSNRNIWLDATVEHTAKAFLATTINCSR